MPHDLIIFPYQDIDGVFNAAVHGVADNISAVQFSRNAGNLKRIAVMQFAAPAVEQVARNGYPTVLADGVGVYSGAIGGDERGAVGLLFFRKINGGRYVAGKKR